MKKFTIFLLVLVFSASAFAASFPDVAQDHKNYQAIEYLDEKGVVKGYQDGTFQPNNLVTRSEALKMIIEAMKIKKSSDFEEIFSDVKKSEWYFEYVMSAKETGIVKGYEDGKFRPNNPVNLAETLKMLLTSAKVDLPEVKDNVFVDTKTDDWFSPFALYAKNKNLILADENGKIYPDQAMTRASFAEIIYRMMIVNENNGEVFPLYKSWGTYESSSLPFKMKYDNTLWQLIENKGEVVFFHPDKSFSQFSPGRIFPNSAVIRVAFDENSSGKTKDQYFENIKGAFSDAQQTEFLTNNLHSLEILYPNERTVDWYIYLDNGKVLAIYTEFGKGNSGFMMQQIIKSMLSTLEYKEVSEKDNTGLLNNIFAEILVEGKGQEIFDMLPDEKIIETDAIGVGTGPVDYYYSAEVDYTFKYERASNTVLDKRKGNTSAF